MTRPLVTIAMPAYNHGRFVAHAIESVLSQTMTDWELIIVDDASTDNTREVISRYSDPRIQYIAHPENRGPAATTNRAFQEARGTWVSLLASDDAYAPTRLEEQLAYVNIHPECGMVMTEFAFMDEHHRKLTDNNHFATETFDYSIRTPQAWLRFFFDKGNCIPAAALLFRKAYLDSAGLMDTRLLQLHDYDLWLRFVLSGCVIGTVHKPLTHYRILQHSGNLSARSLSVRHRCMFERTHILKRFLTLNDAHYFCTIFPEITLPFLIPEQENTWIQHQCALLAWKGGRAHRHFALETWFTLFGNEQQAGWLSSWGMTLRQFQLLTARNPISSSFCYDLQYAIYLLLLKILPQKSQKHFTALLKIMIKKLRG